MGRNVIRSARAAALLGVSWAASACPPDPPPTVVHARADAQVRRTQLRAHVPAGASITDALPETRFEPHWSCRITGLGRVGRPPRVNVPVVPPHAPPHEIRDAIVLRDGSRLEREPARGDAGVSHGRATLRVRSAGGAVQSTLVFSPPPRAAEMLFEDARGAGIAFWDGARIVAQRLGAPSDELLVDAVTDITRGCELPIRDPLRLVPIAPRPVPFPAVSGMPPSVADSRWTLARDATGICVVRIEGEGPWGRVAIETELNGMRGDLGMNEGLYPVHCVRGAFARDGGAGVSATGASRVAR